MKEWSSLCKSKVGDAVDVREQCVIAMDDGAYKISDDCISCGACAAECPVSAISEGDGKFEIDADTCIECGACAGVCPVGAPALDE